MTIESFHGLGAPSTMFAGTIEIGSRVYSSWHWAGSGIVFRIQGTQSVPVRTPHGWSLTGGAVYSVVYDSGHISRAQSEFDIRQDIQPAQPIAPYEEIAAALRHAEQTEAKAAADKAAAEATEAAARRDLPAQYPHLLTHAGKPTWSDHRLVAENIRRTLAIEFPGFKFAVTCHHGTVNVRWDDGPTTAAVDAFASCHELGSFDGMTDSYDYTNDPTSRAFTDTFGGIRYVFCERSSTVNGLRLAWAAAGFNPLEIPDGWHDGACWSIDQCIRETVNREWSQLDLRPDMFAETLAGKHRAQVELERQFAAYVKESWSNVIHRNGQWWIIRDRAATQEFMRKDGWTVYTVGNDQMQPDDTILEQIRIARFSPS
jgi:hypothetical protein